MAADELAKWNDDERARILKSLDDFEPAPSVVVFSGGGYQALWRLDEPLYVGGAEERWADVEAYNRHLGNVLLGDNTWNVDRILRVAGTVNWPDEKKPQKGRTACVARMLSVSSITYPLHAFTAAPADARARGNGTVELPGELPPADLDALPAAVTPRTRVLIV